MIWDDEDASLLPGGKGFKYVFVMLVLGGLMINGLLLWRHLGTGGIVGCGGDSACEELLNSPWSRLLGIPVTAFGVLAYLGLLLAWIAGGGTWCTRILGVILGASLWFIFVQAVLLGRYCPWCMTAHGIGVSVFVLGLWCQIRLDHTQPVWMTAGISAVVVMLGTGLIQHFDSGGASYRTDELKGLSDLDASGIFARGEGRKVKFADGRRSYNVSALPHLGPPDAKCVMVEYLDYGCPSCRVMRGFVDALMAKHPKDLCVIILPVPLERSCNYSLREKDPAFAGSCKLSKLALALWRTKPEGFAGFHHALLDGATPEQATARVFELMSPGEFFAAKQDPWIDELIQANIRDWVAFSASNNKLPKLLISGKRILHGLPSGEADFIRVMERELGL